MGVPQAPPPGGARRRDEGGLAASSSMVMLSAITVALAGIAFLATERSSVPEQAAFTSAPPTRVERQAVIERRPVRRVVRRSTTYVEVFNNSNISGLAGATAGRISAAGWQVVGSDNWYGTIPASTVYFPPRLAAEARLLGRDLGIERILPAVEPMNMDRLTLILTADFA